MAKYISFLVFLVFLMACQKTEVIYDNIANENLELPLLLRLNRKNCVFDSHNRILKYSIDENSINNFSPYVEFQRHSNITLESIKLTNGTVNNFGNIELNKAYRVIINTGNRTDEFTLFFTKIPTIQIVTANPIINGPKTLSRMILNYPEIRRISENNWTGIEQRGSSSLRYDKKSFGIKIYSDKSKDSPSSQSYFDFKQNQKWILDAMFVDQSRLRNKSSFELWKSMSGPANHIGIDSRFVEVYINHQTLGVYSFSENYTKEFLDANDQCVLYAGTDNSSQTEFETLIEKDPNSRFWGDWEQKLPNPSQEIVWDDFEALNTLIVNSSNSEFKNTIAHHIDLNNVIDYFLFINLIGGRDNVGKNWFFFKRDHLSKFNIIPWDMDGTWGRSPFAEKTSYSVLITNNLFKRLLETDPANYKLRLKERWKELRLAEFSESNLNGIIASNFAELDSYKVEGLENNLWKVNLNLKNEQFYMATWVSNRLEFLDERFEY
tara:strand:+ start:7644 stop:9122 length:1479 start_codon:yes stop_codon:yes gene_type:complete